MRWSRRKRDAAETEQAKGATGRHDVSSRAGCDRR